jgi:hypothetical protein
MHMLPRRRQLLLTIVWAPLALWVLATCAAYRGWQINNDKPDNVDQYRQLSFERFGWDLRFSIDQFTFDSCPMWHVDGSVEWGGSWTHVAGFSLWWLVAIAAAPPMVFHSMRRVSGRRHGFEVVTTASSLTQQGAIGGASPIAAQ